MVFVESAVGVGVTCDPGASTTPLRNYTSCLVSRDGDFFPALFALSLLKPSPFFYSL